MAEGFTRALHGDRLEAASAGIVAHGLNPRAVAVMDEVGVDISGHASKAVTDLPDTDFDLVVTVCGHADATCPNLPGARRVVHVPFEDPPTLAADAATEEEALVSFRRVRNEIHAFVVDRLPALLTDPD